MVSKKPGSKGNPKFIFKTYQKSYVRAPPLSHGQTRYARGRKIHKVLRGIQKAMFERHPKSNVQKASKKQCSQDIKNTRFKRCPKSSEGRRFYHKHDARVRKIQKVLRGVQKAMFKSYPRGPDQKVSKKLCSKSIQKAMFKRHHKALFKRYQKQTRAARPCEGGQGANSAEWHTRVPGGPPVTTRSHGAGGCPGEGQLSPTQAPRPCERGALTGQAQLPLLETAPVSSPYRGPKPRSHACSSLFLD